MAYLVFSHTCVLVLVFRFFWGRPTNHISLIVTTVLLFLPPSKETNGHIPSLFHNLINHIKKMKITTYFIPTDNSLYYVFLFVFMLMNTTAHYHYYIFAAQMSNKNTLNYFKKRLRTKIGLQYWLVTVLEDLFLAVIIHAYTWSNNSRDQAVHI